jgi:hypothetical protein
MSIVLFLGKTVKDYLDSGKEKTKLLIAEGIFLCELCLKPMKYQSSYVREIKETEQEIEIIVIWCRKCNKFHALIPDFVLPNKHYSGNEIESVVIDSASLPVNQIDTEASEVTVRRWIKQVEEKIRQTVSILKFLFRQAGQAVSEVIVDAGSAYSELEQVLDMAPSSVKYSGNKLGLANLWLGTNGIFTYI